MYHMSVDRTVYGCVAIGITMVFIWCVSVCNDGTLEMPDTRYSVIRKMYDGNFGCLCFYSGRTEGS